MKRNEFIDLFESWYEEFRGQDVPKFVLIVLDVGESSTGISTTTTTPKSLCVSALRTVAGEFSKMSVEQYENRKGKS